MCGIAGFTVKRPERVTHAQMELLADNLLLGIENRGRDATGLVALSTSTPPVWQKASCDATSFIGHRRSLPSDTVTVILHTRYATQGLAAFPENNHPIRRGSFYIVHNGHLWNDKELFRTTKRKRVGQVDSEAIAAVLADAGELDQLATVVMPQLEGAAAVAAVDERHPGTLAIARGESSPLYYAESKSLVLFASTPEAITGAHKLAIGQSPATKWIDEGHAILWSPGAKPKRETFSVGFSFRADWFTHPEPPKPLAPIAAAGDGWKPSADGWTREPLSTRAQKMIDAAAGSYVGNTHDSTTWVECGMCAQYVDPAEAVTAETGYLNWVMHPKCADDYDDAMLALWERQQAGEGVKASENR